jgi:hypothetical protein
MKGGLVFLCVSVLLLVACGSDVSGGTQAADYPIVTGTASPSQEITPSPCVIEGAENIGRSIADSFPFTNTEEVMGWFCEGAEFEDIMVALETEKHTGTIAEDMLAMRAEGLSWEEIWLVVGFTEQ